MRNGLYSLCLLALLSVCGCSKKDSTSKTDLLTKGSWKVAAWTRTPGLGGTPGTFDFYSHFDPCEKDDYIAFSADGTFDQHNGALKCEPADPASIRGTWHLSNEETKLNTVLPPTTYHYPQLDNVEADILELTETTLDLVYYKNGVTYKMTLKR